MAVQVYTATHDGEGNSLPIIERQFISFKWGYHDIEDFNLLVVFDDRLNKQIYSSFTNTTTNYDGVDGQYYWGTTMNGGDLDLVLATDGMDSREYEEFKNYFRPGETRELILSEYPFRYAMARVSAPPTLSVLPFEKTVVNGGKSFRTTEYRGTINISFSMDDPYWYSTVGYQEEESEEQLKDFYEAGTPTIDFLESIDSCWIGGGNFSNAGTILPISSNALDVSAAPYSSKIFNCSTAKVKPIIYIKMPCEIGDDGKIGDGNLMHLNIGADTFYLSLPPYLAAYNQAIETITQAVEDGVDVIEAKMRLREQIGNAAMRKIALAAFQSSIGDSLVASSVNDFIDALQSEAQISGYVVLTINSKVGATTAHYYSNGGELYLEENAGSCIRSEYPLIKERSEIFFDANGVPSATLIDVTTDFNVNYVKLDYRYTYL